MKKSTPAIVVLGLGYVGLPLLIQFKKRNFKAIGYDISTTRVQQLRGGVDITNEVVNSDLEKLSAFDFVTELDDLADFNTFIVTVPTPIDDNNLPELSALMEVSSALSKILKKGDLVIYESTVYPGATREVCLPILERSGLKLNKDFHLGYSPERINPGDKTRSLSEIKKVVSGSDAGALERVKNIYTEIIDAEIVTLSSIEAAEAAKIIENTQRDLNIALINEFSIILNKMGVSVDEALRGASSKWNFHSYYPGLVGGHCIGVDPYYLAYKAQQIGVRPDVILAGRNRNDEMHIIWSEIFCNELAKVSTICYSSVLILGYTFKADCPDIRNTRVDKLRDSLSDKIGTVSVYDPLAEREINDGYLLTKDKLNNMKFDAIFLAVPHREFLENWNRYEELVKVDGFIFDPNGHIKNASNHILVKRL